MNERTSDVPIYTPSLDAVLQKGQFRSLLPFFTLHGYESCVNGDQGLLTLSGKVSRVLDLLVCYSGTESDEDESPIQTYDV